MKYTFILFVILATASVQAVNYQVFPVNSTVPLSGGSYSAGNIYYGTQFNGTVSALGSPNGPKSADGGTYVLAFPVQSSPYTIQWGWAQNSSNSPNTFHPLQWWVAVPSGSGQTSPHGTYDASGNPVDGNGNVVDPTTGTPLPGQPAKVLLPLQNPFPNIPFGYDWDVIDDATGALIGQGNAQLAPGQGMTVPVTNPTGLPFHVIVYPIVDGARGSPPQTYNSSGGGTSGGSGPVVIGPGQVSAPGATTPPATTATGETQTATQNAINRLATIVQNQGEAEKQQLAALHAQGERQIAATEATTAAVKAQTGGGGGGSGDGITKAQMGDLIDEKFPGRATSGTAESGTLGEVNTAAGGYGTQAGEGVTKIRSIIGKLDGFRSHLALDKAYSQTNWSWSVTVPVVGALNVNIESKWAWVLSLIRASLLALICWLFVKWIFKAVRGTFA